MRSRLTPCPLIFQVIQHDGAWSVEHEGQYSDRSQVKDEVIASATKLARIVAMAGRSAQVRIDGETGYF